MATKVDIKLLETNINAIVRAVLDTKKVIQKAEGGIFTTVRAETVKLSVEEFEAVRGEVRSRLKEHGFNPASLSVMLTAIGGIKRAGADLPDTWGDTYAKYNDLNAKARAEGKKMKGRPAGTTAEATKPTAESAGPMIGVDASDPVARMLLSLHAKVSELVKPVNEGGYGVSLSSIETNLALILAEIEDQATLPEEAVAADADADMDAEIANLERVVAGETGEAVAA